MRGAATTHLGTVCQPRGFGAALVTSVSTMALSLLATPQALSQSAPILPAGGRVVSGGIAIGPTANGNLTVTQSTPTGIVNWHDFSIGNGGKVSFENGQGATLNRVDGAGLSRIDGSLLATGSIYLVNPNGVIIGKNGVVQVGGSFVASTLDITNANFLSGGDKTFSGPATTTIVNLGRIGALGGDVALIATGVQNDGSITASNGIAALDAGSTVLIRDSELDGGRFVVLAGGPGTSVRNSGTISATVAELRAAGGSIYALAGNISGVIAADQVTGNNGGVFLTAGDSGSVSIGSSRITSKTPSYGGTVGISGGTVDIAGGGVIDVSAASIGGQIYVNAAQDIRFAGTANARGDDQGGTVWIFARNVDATTATVDTRGNLFGNWLINQPSLTIDSRLAHNINRYLQTTDLELAANPPDFGENSGDGNITIAAPFNLSSGNRLTLLASNTLRVNQNVTVAGSGVLNLYVYGSDEIGAPITFAPNRSITFTGPANGGQALFINDDQYGLIYNVAGLQAMAADPTGHYAIARSFSASASPLSGPAVGAQGSDEFSGVFEGLNHSINGLRIDAPGQSSVGLFGTVSGSIRDVSLVGGSVVGGSGVGSLAGGLDQGTVLRAVSSASVTARGRADGSSSVGGLVGGSYLGQIASSSATGAVNAPGSDGVGGLIGSGYGLSVYDSFATGAVTGGTDTGGLVGSMSRSGVSGYSTGSVSGQQMVGGLIGAMSYSVTDGRASGRVSGSNMVGGLVGYMLESNVSNGSASGNVIASMGEGGGLVGYLNESGIQLSSASGRVTGSMNIGGLVGASFMSTMSGVVASGYVNGTSRTGQNVGGLVGNSQSDGITQAQAQNVVYGRTNVGGLIGYRHNGTLTDVTATGPVSGTRHVGPLIGLDDPTP
jgi:filamentous hemagglutinin family protein